MSLTLHTALKNCKSRSLRATLARTLASAPVSHSPEVHRWQIGNCLTTCSESGPSSQAMFRTQYRTQKAGI